MTRAEDVDAAIERARQKNTYAVEAQVVAITLDDRALLAAEVVRLRRFIPPDGWVQFGTHANCKPGARIEFSTELGEDGLPLWERPVIEPIHLWGEETL